MIFVYKIELKKYLVFLLKFFFYFVGFKNYLNIKLMKIFFLYESLWMIILEFYGVFWMSLYIKYC